MTIKQAISYRMHAARYGVRRVAEIMCERGIPLATAIDVLARVR